MLRLLLLTCLMFGACAEPMKSSLSTTRNNRFDPDQLIAAEDNASSAGRQILYTGRQMALTTKEIIRGSCWDFINAVYNRSGYPSNQRQKILQGKKNSGPYAKPEQIQAGDWLYHINHSYHDVEHSGIFVYWIDQPKRIALMLSYGGERRNKPGRYRPYDLSHVFTIIRPKPHELTD